MTIFLSLFLLTGAYLTVRSRGFFLRRFGLWNKATFGSLLTARQSRDKHSISQWQALTGALAACLGTGNIVGVATALSLGGPGAIVWMFISAALGTMTICAENILGLKYRRRLPSGAWMGGPMEYLARGLGSKTLGGLYAALLATAAFGIGNMTQANAMAQAVQQSTGLSPWITGTIAAVLVGLVIFGGVKRIGRVTEFVVPIMTGVFLLASMIVLVVHRAALPASIALMVSEAFALRAVAGGTVGYSIKTALRYGVARGVFTNEAGLGTSAVIHAAADVQQPAVQGMWGIAEVVIDTLIMCTVSALVFVASGAFADGHEGVAMASAAYATVFGAAGAHFIALCIVLFAFATLTGWSYFGEQGACWLLGERSTKPYRLLYLGAIVLGSAMQLNLVWSIADVLNMFMALPNLLGVWLLSGQAMRELRKYERSISAY
jgi:AGCS family alanine or glycine:cation symporter